MFYPVKITCFDFLPWSTGNYSSPGAENDALADFHIALTRNNYMNWFLIGIIIFVVCYLIFNWFAKTSSKKIAQFLKKTAVILSLFLSWSASETILPCASVTIE